MTDAMYKLPAIVLLLCFLAACGSAPPRQPIAIAQAGKADMEAHRALRDGDLIRARELFRRSMLLQQSLDNLSESAMAAINLSSVSHKLGDDVTAIALLDRIMSDSTPQLSAELRGTAAFRKAVVLVDGNRTAEAESALQLAAQQCNRQCAYLQGMNNLNARLALDKGDFATALALAKNGLGSSAEKQEQANANRIAAAAEIASGQHDKALEHYQTALELDKELGLSARIAADLHGLANVIEKLGRSLEAEAYEHRAIEVEQAARSLPGYAIKRANP